MVCSHTIRKCMHIYSDFSHNEIPQQVFPSDCRMMKNTRKNLITEKRLDMEQDK